jgi:hypothetical protein
MSSQWRYKKIAVFWYVTLCRLVVYQHLRGICWLDDDSSLLWSVYIKHQNMVHNFIFVDPCITVQFIKKNSTRCNNVLKFYYSIFIWSSTCFGRHTAHHQEPKTALAASGFTYVEGCWTCSRWTLSGTYCAWQRPPSGA